jgi:hypothetical protein
MIFDSVVDEDKINKEEEAIELEEKNDNLKVY